MRPDKDREIIKATGVTHFYGSGAGGIEEISISFARGEFVLIAGANGSGKSTLLKHFNGLLLPDKGEIYVDGLPVHRDLKHVRRKVGMVFQDAESQIVGQTVYEDVAFGPENLCWPRDKIDQTVRRVLAELELTHLAHQSPHLLSGGERRRLAIAGVVAMGPEVIVLDEPFANLDYPGVRQTLASMLRLNRKGHTIIVAAHDIEKIGPIAHRVVIMSKGRIVLDGPTMAVLPQVEQFDIRLPCALRFGRPFTSWLN